MSEGMEIHAADARRSTATTVIVMICTAGSRLFGYVRQALISIYFGDHGTADVLNAVFIIPNNLRKLFAEGAFSAAFIPVLSSTIAEDPSGSRSRELVKNFVAFQALILGPLVALSLIFPGTFVHVLTSFRDPERVHAATILMQWMFNYILLVALSSVVQAVLNTHGSFIVPALSPFMFTLATVLSLFFGHGALSYVAQGLGVLLGGILQLACQLPALRRRGYRFVPSFRFSNPDFRRTAALWVPYLASASIVAINQYVATIFATGLEQGSATAISTSVMFLQIPLGIFTASVTTVLFPRMSRQSAANDVEGLRGSVSYGTQFLVVLLVPASVLLCLFGREVIAAAFQRGQFTRHGTEMSARALTAYATGLLSMGLYTFFQRFFNARKDFLVPVASAGGIAVIDITLSFILKETPLRVSGLAWANSIAFTAGMVALGLLVRRRVGALGGRQILVSLLKAIAGSVPMAVLLVLFRHWQPALYLRGGSLAATAVIAAVAAACIGLTLVMYLFLRVPFLADILRRRRNV